MQTFIILLLLLVNAGLIVFIFRKPKDNSLLMMQNQINQLSQTLDSKLSESSRVLDNKLSESARTMQTQFGQSAKIIRDVTERLTKLDETNKRVVGFTEQLESLQNTLTNPKHRGVLGEYYLETALKNILPPGAYQMQYSFDDGHIVDAVIFDRDKIIPIDSKFSLENYNRIAREQDELERTRLEKQFKADLKTRIDETSKYIKPDKGTTDFAFMYIPAEGIYYDLLVNQIGAIKVNTCDLVEYANKEKHVIIVSPTSFYAYLQTVLQGLRTIEMAKATREIIGRVEILNKHLRAHEDYLKRLGNNLGTTVNAYNATYKELNKVDKDVVKITGGKSELEVVQLEKPVIE